MPQILVDNISLSYGKKTIISNLSFEIERGDYVAILGENGCGKSTLLKAIIGLKEIDEGNIEFNCNKDRIGYLPQQNETDKMFPSTVYEVVKSGSLNKKKFLSFYNKEDRENTKEILKSLKISHLINKSFSRLSGGEKQKVLLARALMATDEILFLDEPTNDLDVKSSEIMYNEIKKINVKSITVVTISHDIKNAIKYANKILHITRDEIFFGTKNEYVNSDFFERKV